MYGFRTVIVTVAAFGLGLALASVPALASGVGGAATEMQSPSPDSQIGGTDVSGTKVVDSDSTIGVTKVFNGVNVGYGQGGSQVMGAVSNTTSEAAAYNQSRHAGALQLENAVLGAIGQ